MSYQDENVCRDFLRNECNRKHCKYYHPDNGNAPDAAMNAEVEFCHDFQNGRCSRRNCKFVHCTKDQEEQYMFSGKLPAAPRNDRDRKTPICKDFLNGKCNRGNNCKYRHDNADRDQARGERMRPGPALDFDNDYISMTDYGYMQAGMKRRRTDFGGDWQLQLVEEDNALLRREVNALRREVAHLKATNEVLLEQNARFRSSAHSASASSGISRVSRFAMNHDLQSSATSMAIPATLMPGAHGSLAASVAMQQQATLQHPQNMLSFS